jgi:hypothetical protein
MENKTQLMEKCYESTRKTVPDSVVVQMLAKLMQFRTIHPSSNKLLKFYNKRTKQSGAVIK